MSNNVAELEQLKDRLEQKLKRLEKLEEHIQNLFPKQIDARSAFVFEQRLKTASELYRLQLAYLQEIARLIERINAIKEGEAPEELMTMVKQQIRKIVKETIAQ